MLFHVNVNIIFLTGFSSGNCYIVSSFMTPCFKRASYSNLIAFIWGAYIKTAILIPLPCCPNLEDISCKFNTFSNEPSILHNHRKICIICSIVYIANHTECSSSGFSNDNFLGIFYKIYVITDFAWSKIKNTVLPWICTVWYQFRYICGLLITITDTKYLVIIISIADIEFIMTFCCKNV